MKYYLYLCSRKVKHVHIYVYKRQPFVVFLHRAAQAIEDTL